MYIMYRKFNFYENSSGNYCNISGSHVKQIFKKNYSFKNNIQLEQINKFKQIRCQQLIFVTYLYISR